jgi:hypothetical protein
MNIHDLFLDLASGLRFKINMTRNRRIVVACVLWGGTVKLLSDLSTHALQFLPQFVDSTKLNTDSVQKDLI